MSKRNKIIYWIATIWLALGMLSSGIVQLMRLDMEIDLMIHLGYPLYFLTILGISKILGVLAILTPRRPRLKEWAYAGFFFTMAGAVFSHLSVGDSIKDIIPALLLLVLTVVSWYFRPLDKKVLSA
ncbi:MAG TPA: DoxX family protein [Candidatus Paceibacterota bacterium]|nr:DoxX family protein [Candidatus Paceibacterota bacterium]